MGLNVLWSRRPSSSMASWAFWLLRFVLAAVALAPYGVRWISLQTLTVGAGVGFALALGYLFQTTATRLALLIVSLGLTLTGALVEQHGGQLKVR